MKIYPPHIFLTSVLVMSALAWWMPGADLISGDWRYLGILPIAVGVFIAVWPSIMYKRRKNPILPDAAPQVLILDGPFRVTRNPMYLGMVLSLLGVGILWGAVTPFLVVPVFVLIITTRFIRMEEQNLLRAFGEAYAEYQKQVRRWI